MPHLLESQELLRFRRQAASWLETEKPRQLAEDFDLRIRQLQQWQAQLYDAGWLGLSWPKEYGGQGRSALEQVAFNLEIVAAKAPMPLGTPGLEIVGPTILRFGTEEQKRRLLPPLLRGDEPWCQGFSEPDAGSDLAALQTRAVREDGTFVVNGQKVWTSLAQIARWCALLVRTGPQESRHRAISYLLVDMASPGITVRPIRQITGDPEFSEVLFENVRVPYENLLGPVNEGWRVAMTTLGFERGPYVLRRTAELRAAFDELVEELRSDAWDASQAERVGRVAIELAALGARGDAILEALVAESSGLESSLDKLILARSEQALFGLALDSLGPFAMTARAPGRNANHWAHEYLYGRAASVYGGTSEIQRGIIAERILGLPRA